MGEPRLSARISRCVFLRTKSRKALIKMVVFIFVHMGGGKDQQNGAQSGQIPSITDIG